MEFVKIYEWLEIKLLIKKPDKGKYIICNCTVTNGKTSRRMKKIKQYLMANYD